MRRRAVVGIVAAVLALSIGSGCVNQNTWRPTVDPYNDPNSERLGIDEAQCRQIAQQSAGGTAQETGKGAAMGGLFGAALGAAIGAAAGNPGEGAAIGAAAGGFGGGARGASKSGDQFKQVFVNCMRGRGHNVLD
jgi:uncharacterized protein YcfJ